MEQAVFIDRDGVINALVERDGKYASPRTFEEFVLLPGVPDAISILQSLGFKCVVVTNQPDISRGLMPIFELEKISEILISQFSDIAIKICPHDDSDNCDCRKPKDGLIIQAALEFGLDPAKSWMVGDRASDIEAGISAGCKVAFINSGQDALEKISHFPKTEIFRDLLDFAHYLTFTSR